MVLACIVWMSNPPDHTAHEILIAAIACGLKYDGLFSDSLNRKIKQPSKPHEPKPYEYIYLDELIEKYKTIDDSSNRKTASFPHSGKYVKKNCPVYLPNTDKTCDTFIFNKNTINKTADQDNCNDIPISIPYHDTIGDIQFVGRNTLLEKSGFLELSNE